jgi:hypothetical protein
VTTGDGRSDITPISPRLALPFPAPGQLVALAYRELDLAANGSAEQIRALGDAPRRARGFLGKQGESFPPAGG